METRILGIDPGTTVSNYVVFDGHVVLDKGLKIPNEELEMALRNNEIDYDEAVIEEIRSYGKAVGQETLETCHWTGRFFTAACVGKQARVACLVPRLEVKLCLCYSARAKDANVRQALLDRWGGKGTKKQPGPLYGVSSHLWAALGVAHWRLMSIRSSTPAATGISGSRTPTAHHAVTPSSTPTGPSTSTGNPSTPPAASRSRKRGVRSAKT